MFGAVEGLAMLPRGCSDNPGSPSSQVSELRQRRQSGRWRRCWRRCWQPRRGVDPGGLQLPVADADILDRNTYQEAADNSAYDDLQEDNCVAQGPGIRLRRIAWHRSYSVGKKQLQGISTLYTSCD